MQFLMEMDDLLKTKDSRKLDSALRDLAGKALEISRRNRLARGAVASADTRIKHIGALAKGRPAQNAEFGWNGW